MTVSEVPTQQSPAGRRPIADSTTLQMLVAVAVPIALLVNLGLKRAVHFDGGMNLQVSQNLANGLGFVRDYGGVEAFPSEIQTSGFYVIFEAILIRIFGPTQWVFQFGNFVALVGLAVAVWIALRPFRLARLVGPTAVVLAIPGATSLALGGLGEYIVASLALSALVILAYLKAPFSRRILTRVFAACLLLGVAITIKFIAVAAIPPVALALMLALVGAKPRFAALSGVVAMIGILAPIIAFEIYRLASLGGLDEYLNFWQYYSEGISYQAGLDATGTGLLEKAAHHLSLLAAATGIHEAFLVFILAMPFVGLVLPFGIVRSSPRRWLSVPQNRLMLSISLYCALYVIWWFFVTPDEKAWLRRLIIGIIALVVMYLLQAPLAYRQFKRRRPGAVNSLGAAIILLCSAAVFVFVGVPTISKNGQSALQADPTGLTEAQAAGAWVAGQPAEVSVFGIGWWSSPVVSLEADTPFGDLSVVDPCMIGESDVVMWDTYARSISAPEPALEGYSFTAVQQFGNYATSFLITPHVPCP